jgi:hypothetical protein
MLREVLQSVQSEMLQQLTQDGVAGEEHGAMCIVTTTGWRCTV